MLPTSRLGETIDLVSVAQPPVEVPWHCPQFEPALEWEFLNDSEQVWLRIARNWLLLVAGLGAAMVWAAGLSGRDAMLAALTMQGLGSLPAALVGRHLLGRMPLGKKRETAFGAAALVILFCIVASGWWASAAHADRYVMAGGMALFGVLVLVPLRLRRSALLGILGLMVLAATALLPAGQEMRKHWDIVVFTALLLPLGLRVRAGAERDMRQVFLLRRHEDNSRRALARANERLRELSETDPLTGVANRRCYDETLDALLSHNGGDAALLLLDVDYFKRLNDVLGHAEGDNCLRLVAAALCSQVRGRGDLVARIGGEEFAVLLPSATAAEAAEVAERVRLAIEVMLLPHPGRPEPPMVVTVSVGLAILRPSETALSLQKRADAALYAAKAAGRNRVCASPLAEQARRSLIR